LVDPDTTDEPSAMGFTRSNLGTTGHRDTEIDLGLRGKSFVVIPLAKTGGLRISHRPSTLGGPVAGKEHILDRYRLHPVPGAP